MHLRLTMQLHTRTQRQYSPAFKPRSTQAIQAPRQNQKRKREETKPTGMPQRQRQRRRQVRHPNPAKSVLYHTQLLIFLCNHNCATHHSLVETRKKKKKNKNSAFIPLHPPPSQPLLQPSSLVIPHSATPRALHTLYPALTDTHGIPPSFTTAMQYLVRNRQVFPLPPN